MFRIIKLFHRKEHFGQKESLFHQEEQLFNQKGIFFHQQQTQKTLIGP